MIWAIGSVLWCMKQGTSDSSPSVVWAIGSVLWCMKQGTSASSQSVVWAIGSVLWCMKQGTSAPALGKVYVSLMRLSLQHIVYIDTLYFFVFISTKKCTPNYSILKNVNFKFSKLGLSWLYCWGNTFTWSWSWTHLSEHWPLHLSESNKYFSSPAIWPHLNH